MKATRARPIWYRSAKASFGWPSYRFTKSATWRLSALLITFLSTAALQAETLSFNNSGEFSTQFTQKAGIGNNLFEEFDGIGVSGSRAIQRSATGSERISYIRNSSMGQLLNSASLSLKFKYSTNATGSGGEPLFFGVSPNSSFNGDWTGGSSADYIGVELSQRLTGSNESKLVLFNGVDGSRSAEADSAFENLSPGWYEIELNVEQAAGLLDLSVALHKLSTDGSARETTDVVTGAISSLTNADLQNAGGLYIFLGGGDTLNRGIVAMDDLNFFGFGTPGVIVSPSGLAATTVSANQINLSWSDNSDNETQFHVERRLSGGNWSLVTSLGSGVTSYSDTGLNQGTTYFYRVSASNNESTSSPSNEASATTSSTGGGSVAAPTHLSAVSLTSSEIKVAWTDNSDNETAFLVERRLESGSWSQVASVPANSINYLNTGLSADTTFFYRVIATNGSTNSDPSNQASAITSTSGRPSVPGNLVASAVSGTQINLTWTDTSNNETWFRIERRVGSGSWIDLIDLTGNSTSHSDTGLTADTTYTYRIRSGNAAGLSNPGNEASATTTSGISINAPTNLAATAASDRQINLSWTDNSTNETSFRVQRRQGSSSWAEIVSLAPNSTSYSDSGLAQETSYSYRILASNNGAFSSPSNEASATTQGEPAPTPPANLVASARTMSQIDLSWSDTSSNETWFRIQRRVGSGNWADLVDLAANSTNYSDTGLSSNTSYTYRMRAGNATGLSTLSNEASATTPTEPVPNGPTNLQNASPDFSKISLSWTDNANDESGYRIQRKVGSNNFEQIAQLPAGTTSFEDTEITDYQTYVYYVYAYNDIGSSAFSNLLAVDIPFFSPTNLVAVSPASDRVDLSWSDNSKVETSYRIQRRKGTGSWITMVNVGENVASYSDVTVEAETTYTYRVQGIRHSYFSEYTNFVSLTTPAVQPPTAPSGLVIASQGLDHVVLQWSDKSTKETGFIIERTTNGGGWETLIQLGRDVVTYTDGQVSELGNYQYRVVSYNAGGNSSPSNVVSTMIDFDNPTDLTALAISSGQVDLSWTDNSSAEGNYRVERKSAQGAFEVLKLLAANSTNYSDTDVEPLSTYTYRVVAIQGDLSSQPTNEASANTPNIPAPGSAGNLAAVLSSEGIISVTWEDNSITEAGFRLERMVGTGAWSRLDNLSPNTTSYQDAGISELQSFAYRVISFNDGGESSASNVASVSVPFKAPTDLVALASAGNRIDLLWADNSTVETGYRIERKSGAGAFEVLATLDADAVSYADETVVVDTAYTYQVVGLYEGGESSPTNEASATTSSDTTAPNAPTGLAAVAQGYSSIQLSWTDNADNESGFRIERKTGVAGTFTFVGTAVADATSWLDENLEPDTTYIYRIAAFLEGAQASEATSEASATTSQIPVPDAPSGLEIASQTFSVVSLSWTDNSDVESGFKIQRKADDSAFEDLAVVGEGTTFFSDDSVSENHSYNYRVIAYNAQGDSLASNEANAIVPLAAPGSLVGTAVSSTSVELTWQDVSVIETGYRIERKTDSEAWTSLAEVGANKTVYSDTVVEPDTTYSYRIVTLRFGAESAPGNVVNVTTQNTTLPDAPSNLVIQSLSETSISVAWTDNSDNEDGFYVYRKEAKSGVWVKIADVSADVNLYVDNKALPGVSYAYRVSSYNGGGEETPVEKDFRIPINGRLINISTRGLVETGDNVMIGSFIVRGDGPKTVLIRGMGPSLASSLKTQILADPEVTLVSGVNLDRPLAYNDDWRDTDEQSVIAAGLPPAYDTESAIVIRLQPGAYSAILSGVNATTGFGLIEVYEVDYAKNIRMINISTRTFVQEGDKRMIGGFVIRGDTPARVFIRANGPSLPESIPNRLADPTLELYAGPERIMVNDNWQEGDQTGLIIASGIPPGNLKEPALVATLPPGAYTAVVGGAGNTSGYSLLEIYDYPE